MCLIEAGQHMCLFLQPPIGAHALHVIPMTFPGAGGYCIALEQHVWLDTGSPDACDVAMCSCQALSCLGLWRCSWAAYVAGPLVVLMHELGLRYPQGISLLLSSAVPEGKGVSSSAAVEVAVMQALCAAHDVHIDGRHLALLCQKVGTCLHSVCC